MSGRPNESDIEKLRQSAARVRELDLESDRLRGLILDFTLRLEAAETQRRNHSGEVIELLRKMDCASDGNVGWEGRIVWFLSELATSAEKYGSTHL